MGVVEDVRQVIQDFLAPELRAITARLDVSDRINDAQHKETLALLGALNQKVDSLHREALARADSLEEKLTSRLDQIVKNFDFDKRRNQLRRPESQSGRGKISRHCRRPPRPKFH